MWRKILEHAQTITKREIDQNIVKHRELLLHLKRSCTNKPDIDTFSLQNIFMYFFKDLQFNVNKIKKYCKENNL